MAYKVYKDKGTKWHVYYFCAICGAKTASATNVCDKCLQRQVK